jgi:hypothetical protein
MVRDLDSGWRSMPLTGDAAEGIERIGGIYDCKIIWKNKSGCISDLLNWSCNYKIISPTTFEYHIFRNNVNSLISHDPVAWCLGQPHYSDLECSCTSHANTGTHTFFFFFPLHHTNDHFSTSRPCGDFARVYPRSRLARLAFHHLVITIDQRPEQYTWHRRFLYVRKELQELKAEVKTNSPAMSLSHVDKHHYGNRLNSADPLFLYYIHYPPIFVLSLQILFNTHLTWVHNSLPSCTRETYQRSLESW